MIPTRFLRITDASSFDRREKQYSAVARWSIITATKRLCLHLESILQEVSHGSVSA
jgi:hypothetical protein